jgi:preprotein translocase subunit YajC
MDNLWILAQADNGNQPSDVTSVPLDSEPQDQTTTTGQADPNSTGVGRRPGPFGGGTTQLIVMGMIFVLMYMMLFRGPRRKQQQHKQMIQALSKNDKIQTIGGIIGTVVDIKDEEITLKIDESNNTKMKILRSAISRNMSKDKS